ncbi:pumilio domain-containing protein C56F2.08c [Colletotrichum liriopes]|uniref:Pumilio domain-containing protein C56F2.08c n=1 Tax=Colletotrichum liriopes TaxID=708192 RepID=A0AA37GH85_9PEZI|nr:pumilio domain-containing protein C56F2.08c [Colletotrichum liriopes]
MASASRSGAGSPSHEMPGSSRLFSKRAREIQAQEGVPGLPVNPWGGPPTSGNSTPLRENIPESPTDGFPDFAQLPTPDSMPQARRARAGTVPSRFSPGGAGNGLLSIPAMAPKSSRPTPSHSPFKSPSPGLEPTETASNNSALLSRLRAGSMPQRSPFAQIPGTSSPFGPSIFSSWNPTGTGRDRGMTLASIASIGSTNGPSSPTQSQISREGAGRPPRAQLATPYIPSFNEFTKANRFRSYSVNNKDKYADEEEDDFEDNMTLESQYVAHLQDQLAATNAAIHNHNLAVQAFANQATRPRARTAGVLDTPGSRLMRTYIPPAEIRLPDEKEFDDLPQAVAAMNLGRSSSRNAGLLNAEDQGLEGPTSALWLGSIPTSTTTSTLTEMFKSYGPILSARVLTHKNCGFVNFERMESAITAKASMNGKEIFPGAGPIRINFAKPPSASNTPGPDGVFPSPSPDPFSKNQDNAQNAVSGTSADSGNAAAQSANAAPTVPPLSEMTNDILRIVKQFQASDEDTAKISRSLQSSIQFTNFIDEIPPFGSRPTPGFTTPRDSETSGRELTTRAEIETTALDMLPEIAELSSDYLGNTVVQKLFEHCSDELRDAMLAEIALTWRKSACTRTKIIDVCKTPHQMTLIVENLRPYTIPLFLDQYGNYVLQGCLKFGAPFNDFIFETMLSRMWEVAQGRYGARAMRACLESHHATKEQQRMLAAAIALHSDRFVPQLVPYLVHLCTHKVAYLTVLKVINQKAEPEARDTILKALFFTPNDQVLEAILSDHACGATLIFKVLTTPFFDESIRSQVVENVKNVLVRIKAQPGQGYKRLMDEVGLSTRNSGGGGGGGGRDHGHGNSNNSNNEQRQRPASRQANMTAHHQQAAHMNKQQYYNPLNQSVNASNYELGFGGQRSEPTDAGMPPFPPYGVQNPMYNPSNSPMPTPANLQQLQYQQNMLNRATPPAGFGGYSSPSPSIDQYRSQNLANGSPIQPPAAQLPQMPPGQAPYAPPGFGMNMGMTGYGGYGNMGGMQNMAYMQQEQVNGRRGRHQQQQQRKQWHD